MSMPLTAGSLGAPDVARADRLAFFMLKTVNRAIYDHALIQPGDRILVATSGGKDSLTLLDMLRRRQRSAPESYQLFAGHARSDYHCGHAVSEEWLASWCAERDIPLERESLAVSDAIADLERGRCFRCSRVRRRALFTMAQRMGCAKIAMGHHADDAAETVLMNLFFSGQVRGLDPAQELFQGQLTVIRPLAYVEERDIVTYARAAGYPIEGEPCPDGQASRRALVKQVLRTVERSSPRVKRCIHGAVSRYAEAHLPAHDEPTEPKAGSDPTPVPTGG
jgi:tRNA 2-thiocytidine biosynthesis protein TtcA